MASHNPKSGNEATEEIQRSAHEFQTSDGHDEAKAAAGHAHSTSAPINASAAGGAEASSAGHETKGSDPIETAGSDQAERRHEAALPGQIPLLAPSASHENIHNLAGAERARSSGSTGLGPSAVNADSHAEAPIVTTGSPVSQQPAQEAQLAEEQHLEAEDVGCPHSRQDD